MTRQALPPPLPHREDCNCECHPYAFLVDDGECGNPPDYGPRCCYGYIGGPRESRPVPCEGCDTPLVRLHDTEGLLLCRECRRSLRA